VPFALPPTSERSSLRHPGVIAWAAAANGVSGQKAHISTIWTGAERLVGCRQMSFVSAGFAVDLCR
jgi:hypothetical protein